MGDHLSSIIPVSESGSVNTHHCPAIDAAKVFCVLGITLKKACILSNF